MEKEEDQKPRDYQPEDERPRAQWSEDERTDDEYFEDRRAKEEKRSIEHKKEAETAKPEVAPEKAAPEATKPESILPGVIVLGWLTYAFWGWLIIVVIWLTNLVFTNAILDERNSEITPYAIAAGVVLLPIAFVCDRLYRKHEPIKKTGISMIIMVIHAVIFALLTIGALIFTLFNTIDMVSGDPFGHDRKTVTILTGLIATFLYAGAFLRTLNLFKTDKVPKIYSLCMLIISLILLTLTVVGPALQSFQTREDKIVVKGLPEISRFISEYTKDNGKLPESLKDIDPNTKDAEYLIENDKVEYVIDENDDKNQSSRYGTEHRYQLCVEYSGSENTQFEQFRQIYLDRHNEYQEILIIDDYDKGEQCYKLQVTTYDSDSFSEDDFYRKDLQIN